MPKWGQLLIQVLGAVASSPPSGPDATGWYQLRAGERFLGLTDFSYSVDRSFDTNFLPIKRAIAREAPSIGLLDFSCEGQFQYLKPPAESGGFKM